MRFMMMVKIPATTTADWIIDVRSKAEAVEWAVRAPMAEGDAR